MKHPRTLTDPIRRHSRPTIGSKKRLIIPLVALASALLLLTSMDAPFLHGTESLPRASAASRDVIFMHHSVGRMLMDGSGGVGFMISQGYDFWDHDYNSYGASGHGLRHNGVWQSYDYTVPSDRIDVEVWPSLLTQPVTITPEGSAPVNTLSGMLRHDVIIIKGSWGQSIVWTDQYLADWETYSHLLCDLADRYPGKLFIAVTSPPVLHDYPSNSLEVAARARALANYMRDTLPVRHPNVRVIDLFGMMADDAPAAEGPNFLNHQWATSDSDSHPNVAAQQHFGPKLMGEIDSAIKDWAGTAGTPGPTATYTATPTSTVQWTPTATLIQTSTPTTQSTPTSTPTSAPTTTPVGSTTYSLFPASATPAAIAVEDPNAIELGVKFSSSTSGVITGVRFYKSLFNTGTHVGSLWSSSGQLLARATFSNETASGWQEVSFSTPVAISPNTVYVASYHTDTGYYSNTTFYFNSPSMNGPLTALQDGASGPNGVYLYTASSAFPTGAREANNYWVDVVFSSAGTPVPTATLIQTSTPTTQSTPTSTPTSEWTQIQHDAQRTGYSPETLGTNFRLAWTHPFQPERVFPQVQAIIHQGMVFVGTESGNLYALDAQTGSQHWVFHAGGPILASVGADNGKVFFGAMDGAVYGIDASTGNQVWKNQLSKKGFSVAPVISDGLIMLGGRDGRFYALSPDGTLAWTNDVGSPILQTAAASNGRVYFGAMDMRVRALTTTGTLSWVTERLQGGGINAYFPVVSQGKVVVSTLPNSVGPGLSPDFPWGWHSDTNWISNSSAALAAGRLVDIPGAMSAQDVVVTSTLPKSTYVFDAATGAETVIPHWTTQAHGGTPPPPSVTVQGLLVMPVMMMRSGWGLLDLAKARITDVLYDGFDLNGQPFMGSGCPAGMGNNDENLATSSSSNLVLGFHTQEMNANYTGFFDQATRRWHQVSAGWTNGEMFNNLQGGGTNAPSIANGMVYHITVHELVARTTR